MVQVKPVTVGFIGTGRVNSRNVNALLADFVDARQGKVRFLLPLTVESFTESLEYVYQFALDYDIDVKFIVDETTAENKKFSDMVESVGNHELVANVIKGVTGSLIAADNSLLIIAWDDDDESCLDALDIAVNHNIDALDITNGLLQLKFVGEDDEEQEKAGDPPVENGDKTDDTPTSQQSEHVGSTVSVDSEWAEISADQDRSIDDSINEAFPIHAVLERLDRIEHKLRLILGDDYDEV